MPAVSDYPVPAGIPTSLTVPELRLLQHYAAQAGTVLEIGTYYGYSCIGMALAGAHVTSVDPHTPDASGSRDTGATYEDTWEPFCRHVERHGFPCQYDMQAAGSLPDYREFGAAPGGRGVRINCYRTVIESSQMTLEFNEDRAPFRVGLVFIDGDHMYPAPMRDARIALSHLRAPGYVAFHDVTPTWLDVWLTVRELERTGELVKLEQERYLAVYQAAEYRT